MKFIELKKYYKTDVNKKSFRINANERPHFSIVPTCSFSHKFSGVRELLDTFPSLSEGIFPLKAFEIDGVMVKEYETLRVLTKASQSSFATKIFYTSIYFFLLCYFKFKQIKVFLSSFIFLLTCIIST